MEETAQSGVLDDELYHLARLALAGRAQDVQGYVRQFASRHRRDMPDLAARLRDLLAELPTRSAPLRGVAPLPLDLDTRLPLVRVEEKPVLDHEPIWLGEVELALAELRRERERLADLVQAGVRPTRTILFTGPPGVGKTMAARWLAREWGIPLLVLDLAAVMSSFLGRTGNNLRFVLDYAKQTECVLLLDEFDSVAKYRDDAHEVGELKRLVTVLLQEVDDWPETGLLVAATNHPGLLDPAAWRRFDRHIAFPMPDDAALQRAIGWFCGAEAEASEEWRRAVSMTLRGCSFSDVEREIVAARRAVILRGERPEGALVELARTRVAKLSRLDLQALAVALVDSGVLSQRAASELTGVSRVTISKRLKGPAVDDFGEAGEG